MRAASVKHWSVRLTGVIGTVWLLRWLWVQYGQHCRAIRLLSRSMLNPIALTFAGRAGMAYAILFHVGRFSGRRYATPVLVQPVTQSWIIPLTYGEVTDWYRNIEKAGECRIQWQGQSSLVGRPERMDGAHAYPLFPFALRLAGIRQFVRLARV